MMLNRNFIRRFACILVLWFAVCTLLTAQTVSTSRQDEVTLRNRRIARAAVSLLTAGHYNMPQVTPQLKSRWYEAYFDLLDHNRIYFLKSDVERFRVQEETLWQNESGYVNLDLSLEIYELYMKRVQEWVDFSNAELQKEQDYSVKEYMPVNTEPGEIEWCSTPAELRERWRKRIKNLLLEDKLNQEERESKASDAKAAKKDGDAKPVKRKDIRERTRKNMENLLKLRQEADQEEVMSYILNAFAGLLDPHSSYILPADKENFDISMSLSLQGIGATLQMRDSFTTIVDLIPGGPAARDGRLNPGDRIIGVAQSEKGEVVDAENMALDKVVQLIRGKKGTEVYLTILPDGSSSSYVIRLVRDEVVIKDAEARGTIRTLTSREGVSKRILHIYLPSFYCDFEAMIRRERNYKSSSRDVANIIRNARKKGPVDGVILDLRGNGGGALNEAVELCGLFSSSYLPVVQQQRADRRNHLLADTRRNAVYEGPLMVMVDHSSASASEIAAACLQDCGRAVIVGGNTTFGKGTIQQVVDISETDYGRNISGGTGAVKVTIGKFYRINGGATQEKGVIPDIIFPTFAEYMGYGEAKMPNVLPWDRTTAVKYTVDKTIFPRLDKLRAIAAEYMKTNANFREYAAEVEKYRKLRERKQLPLEINERREYREQEMRAVRQMRRFAPDRRTDDRPTLKDEDEDLYEDKNAVKRDVILDASLELMFRFVELSEAGNK